VPQNNFVAPEDIIPGLNDVRGFPMPSKDPKSEKDPVPI